MVPVVAAAILATPFVWTAVRSRPGGPASADLHVASHQAWAAYSTALARSKPEDAALARDTRMYVDHSPQDWELRSVGLAPNERDRLLGIYYVDPEHGVPPTIVLYADAISAQGMSVRDVLWHELGHRYGFDHQLRDVAAGCRRGPDGAVVDVGGHDHAMPIIPATAADTWGSGCPVCLLHDRTAVARCLALGIAHTPSIQRVSPSDGWNIGAPWWSIHDDLAIARGLADGLAFSAATEQTIPRGLGGTVPGIRRHLGAAAAYAPQLDGFADPGLVAALELAVAAAVDAYSGTVTPETSGAGSDRVVAAWELAWSACAGIAPAEAAPRLRHALAEASGMVGPASAKIDPRPVALAVEEAQRDCAGGAPVCADATEAAWWACYTAARSYFAGGPE